MNSKPLVSIISSIYNVEKYLPRMLDSILNQTYSNLEFVLVDNASTDGSNKILEDYKKKDNRIKIIKLSVNKGPSGGLNEAIRNIKGEYFTEIDSDDWIENDCIEKVITKINADIDFAMWKYREFYEDGKIIEPKNSFNEGPFNGDSRKELLIAHLLDYSGYYGGFYLKEVGTPWVKLYKTSSVIGIYYNEDFALYADYLFNIEAVLKCNNFYLIDSTFYNLRRGTTSYSSTVTTTISKCKERYNAIIAIENNILDYIDNEDIKTAWNIFLFKHSSFIVRYLSSQKLKDIKKFFSNKMLKNLISKYRFSLKNKEHSFKSFIKQIILCFPFRVSKLFFRR